MHSFKWEWCYLDKAHGGLGLKDLKKHVITLAAKWILKALDGKAPWKVLIRKKIVQVVPKLVKSWKVLPLSYLLISKHQIVPTGSVVFRSIWRAWELIKGNVKCPLFLEHSANFIHPSRSIWWNLEHNGKPLALLQGCSAKKWAQVGIKTFSNILRNGVLVGWVQLKEEFNLPQSNFRTYFVLKVL